MPFIRQPAESWHQEVPGSRWFRGDLHVHTVDDLPGGRVRVPQGLSGDLSDPEALDEYARVVLQTASRNGIQVLGLTPHCPRMPEGSDRSAVWAIIEMWNTGADEDGVPFRDKVYAVFPGFEPNVNDGRGGVHLLFLFDPEIGRERYLSLFGAIMDGRSPWEGANLRLTSRDARDILRMLDDRRQEEECAWDFLVLAPHFANTRGLLHEVQAQVLELFPAARLAGYELASERLPQDYSRDARPGSFLLPFMEERRQAFFHASDAYGLPFENAPAEEGELGYRTTWFKLAAPRIEALRQAFIASECRLRIGYERDGERLAAIAEPPDPLRGTRPWLRSVSITGEAAFFGGSIGDVANVVQVDLSPDLTCVIGGSMTGKSTLLDGLRVHIGAELPSDGKLLRDVRERAEERFLAGQPNVTLDTPGWAQERLIERWPAVFFSQNELQRLAQDEAAVEEVLTRMLPDEGAGIVERAERLAALDRRLGDQARSIESLLDTRAEIEQKLSAALEAEQALTVFTEAGLDALKATQKLRSSVEGIVQPARDLVQEAGDVTSTLRRIGLDEAEELEIAECLERTGTDAAAPIMRTLQANALAHAVHMTTSVQEWSVEVARVLEALEIATRVDQQAVEKRLAELGFGAEKLAEFQTLSTRAAAVAGYRNDFDAAQGALEEAVADFETNRAERTQLVTAQREAFDRIRESVEEQFDGRIRVRRIDHGDSDSLTSFLVGLKQKGITQWWNGLQPDRRPSSDVIFEKLQNGELRDLGASETVAERFVEAISEAKTYQLLSIRSPDRHALEHQVGDGEYRDASRLSGGKRVSLLLSLLLEGHDERPLVIDQPEDELDNRFLWEEVLPALRRLKGKRQILIATHDANVVVNADADLVVLLEADADHGRVALTGAIEDPAVRRAIIETVDGGETAFELRQTKYGF